MASTNEKFGKAYKLCSEKQIQELFKKGKKQYAFPFSCLYQIDEEIKKPPFQLVISVPKRNFKKAVDRNRLKRLIREAVRKNKLTLENCLEKENIGMAFVLVYTHKEHLSFGEINEKIRAFFSRLIFEITNEKND